MDALFTIRPFSNEYLQQAAEIHRLSFPQAWSETSLRSALAVPHTLGWTAVDAHQPSLLYGFLIARLLIDEAEILTLAVHPAQRRKNIAFCLLKYLDACIETREIKCLLLEVNPENSPALRLYERVGFHKIAERPHYFLNADGSRTTAYVLVKHY